MIRYFYLLGLWMTASTLLQAHLTQKVDLSGSANRHFAPTDDWVLPSFDVNLASKSDKNNTSPAPKTEKRSIASSHQDSSTPFATRTVPSEARGGDSFIHQLASTTKSDSRSLAHTLVSKTKEDSHALASAVVATAQAAGKDLIAGKNGLAGRLARLTAYWSGEGDYYTGRGVSATGIHLHGGHCAVDPSIIPYGSVVVISGVGQFLAVDTGSAVISREAAREAGHNHAERSALVIDLYFEHARDGRRFAAEGPKFASISWWTPSSTSHAAQAARSVFADEDWHKIYSKQL
jgi:3D (Asp-Asp-Asp) domain-containing protein